MRYAITLRKKKLEVQREGNEKWNKVVIFVCFCAQKVFSSLDILKIEPLESLGLH